MTGHKTYGKVRQRVLVQVPLHDPVVSCNRIRLAMIRKSNPKLRLPNSEDAAALQKGVGERKTFEMSSLSPSSSVTIYELQYPFLLEKRIDGWYRNRRPREEAEAVLSTTQEIS